MTACDHNWQEQWITNLSNPDEQVRIWQCTWCAETLPANGTPTAHLQFVDRGKEGRFLQQQWREPTGGDIYTLVWHDVPGQEG